MPDSSPAPKPRACGTLLTDRLLVASGPELTARQLHDLLKLRVDVFVVEQDCAYPELDGLDLLETTRHIWLSDAAGPQVALRTLDDSEGRRIGRVVTRPDQRGTGLAGQLMEWVHGQLGSTTTVLDGQSHLRSFYERLGYQVVGSEFVEDGIPHFPMRRTNAQCPRTT